MSASNINSISIAVLEQNPIRQFAANPSSQKAAIKAKCAECLGCTSNHLERGFRASISECSSYSCSLHSFRPFQAKTTSK
jgi:hypothetical protein